jgi:hypothetical protein
MDDQSSFGPKLAQVDAAIASPGLGCFKFHAMTGDRAVFLFSAELVF